MTLAGLVFSSAAHGVLTFWASILGFFGTFGAFRGEISMGGAGKDRTEKG